MKIFAQLKYLIYLCSILIKQMLNKLNPNKMNTKSANNSTIFYVNSVGMMAQWKGQIIAKDEKSISIRFSKNKALKFNLKDLDIDFCLVTNKVVKCLGVCISKTSEVVCFDDNLKRIVIENTKGNVKNYWNNGKWEI